MATVPPRMHDPDFFRAQFRHQRSLKGSIQRITEYAKSQSAAGVIFDVAVDTIKNTACGAAVGGGVGAICGGMTAGPPGALALAIEGAKYGAVAGFIFSAYSGCTHLFEEFPKWKADHMADQVWDRLKELGRQEGLDEFECPITFDWIVDPAITNCGHIFEREELARTLEIAHRCPTCNYSEGLTYASAPHVTVAFKRAVANLIQKEGSDDQLPEDVRAGFIALSNDLGRIADVRYREACAQLHQLCASNKISLVVYDRHQAIIDSVFYPEDKANA